MTTLHNTVNPLQSEQEYATLSLEEMRTELQRMERQLIPLLLTIQRLLGKEPSILTREQRRKLAAN